MNETTTSIQLNNANTGHVTQVDETVWGMPQFKEKDGENQTNDEYLETVIYIVRHIIVALFSCVMSGDSRAHCILSF